MTQQVVIFGEVLFDCFPDGKVVLGGAPFNIAWNLQALGVSPLFISRIGKDSLGAQIKQSMLNWGMDISGLQEDPTKQTGVVDVKFVHNEPQYEIVNPCAYDYIEATALPEIAQNALLYHGTLALRNEVSATTLEQIKQASSPTVFIDVNLRNPWWETSKTLQLLTKGKWVKLNEEELIQLVSTGKDVEGRIDHLMAQIPLEGVIVTQGERGAMVVTKTGDRHQVTPQKVVSVVDTVGAGDGFSSVFLLGLIRGWPLPVSLERAQAFASAIVGIQGATNLNRSFYDSFIKLWD